MARYTEPPIDPIFVSVKDAAKILGGITPWEVYRLLDSQKIASQYHGRRRLVDLESLREFAKQLPTTRPEKKSESA